MKTENRELINRIYEFHIDPYLAKDIAFCRVSSLFEQHFIDRDELLALLAYSDDCFDEAFADYILEGC